MPETTPILQDAQKLVEFVQSRGWYLLYPVLQAHLTPFVQKQYPNRQFQFISFEMYGELITALQVLHKTLATQVTCILYLIQLEPTLFVDFVDADKQELHEKLVVARGTQNKK